MVVNILMKFLSLLSLEAHFISFQLWVVILGKLKSKNIKTFPI